MAKKQVIRLSETDLHNIIKESVTQVLREQDEQLKWEKLFQLWREWNEVGATCYLNNEDKMLVKTEVENNPQLLNYLNSEEYGKIIKLLSDKIERIGSMSKAHERIDSYLEREREFQDDTLW
jgi:hypothetical protein